MKGIGKALCHMLNILKFDKFLSIFLAGLENSIYFCISKFDKYDKRFNKELKLNDKKI